MGETSPLLQGLDRAGGVAPTTAGSSSLDEYVNVEGQASVHGTTLNLMKTCMGTGLLGLPFSCSQGGIVIYVVGLALVGSWNSYSVQRLCRCLEYLPYQASRRGNDEGRVLPMRAKDESAVYDESSSKSDTRYESVGSSTLSLVAWHAYGKIGFHLMDAMLLVLLFGIILSYISANISFLGDLMGKERHATTAGYVTCDAGTLVSACSSAAVIACLSLVPNTGALARASAMGLIVLLTIFFIVADYGIGHRVAISSMQALHWWPESCTGLAHWFGVSVFGYGVVPMTYNYRAAMREPSRIVEANVRAMIGVSVAYIIWGLVLYYLFPDINGEILHELPASGVVPIAIRLAMVTVVLVTAPLIVVPCAELVEGRCNTGRYRLLVRFGICAACAAVAVLLPDFVTVLSLVGSACVALTSFVAPPLLHIQLARKAPHLNAGCQCVDMLMLILGTFAALSGTYFIVVDKNNQNP